MKLLTVVLVMYLDETKENSKWISNAILDRLQGEEDLFCMNIRGSNTDDCKCRLFGTRGSDRCMAITRSSSNERDH